MEEDTGKNTHVGYPRKNTRRRSFDRRLQPGRRAPRRDRQRARHPLRQVDQLRWRVGPGGDLEQIGVGIERTKYASGRTPSSSAPLFRPRSLDQLQLSLDDPITLVGVVDTSKEKYTVDVRKRSRPGRRRPLLLVIRSSSYAPRGQSRRNSFSASTRIGAVTSAAGSPGAAPHHATSWTPQV